jgi:hypothetical protein
MNIKGFLPEEGKAGSRVISEHKSREILEAIDIGMVGGGRFSKRMKL